MTDIKFHVGYNPAKDAYDLWAVKRVDGKQQMASVVCFYEAPVNQVTTPCMEINAYEAQALLDTLWAAGIRPKTESTVGQLAAVSYHLEDMRKLAFSNLGHS